MILCVPRNISSSFFFDPNFSFFFAHCVFHFFFFCACFVLIHSFFKIKTFFFFLLKLFIVYNRRECENRSYNTSSSTPDADEY